MGRIAVFGASLAALALLWCSGAAAQSSLANGQAALASADFDGAVAAFSEAERADEGLNRAELATLYSARAQARWALGQEDEARGDLRRLLSVDSAAELDYTVRPEIREALEALRGEAGEAIAVSAEVAPQTGGVVVRGAAQHDAHGIVRAVRVAGRVRDGDWLTGNDSLVVPVASDGLVVEYHAAAIGPGGAVLAADGGQDEPLTYTYQGAIADGGPDDAGLGGGSGDDDAILWAIAGGAIAVGIAVVIVVLVVVTAGNDATQPGVPSIFPAM